MSRSGRADSPPARPPPWELVTAGKVWAEAHMDEVLANREKYDTRVA